MRGSRSRRCTWAGSRRPGSPNAQVSVFHNGDHALRCYQVRSGSTDQSVRRPEHSTPTTLPSFDRAGGAAAMQRVRSVT